MGRRGKSPPARLTVHQGQGLTPHQTWPLHARRSGPSSLLQLKGEEREINGETNVTPVHQQNSCRSQPSSLQTMVQAPMMDTKPLIHSALTSIPQFPASVWIAAGATPSMSLAVPGAKGRVTCGVKGWSRPVSRTVLHGVDFHKFFLEDRKQVGNPVVQPHIQDELAEAEREESKSESSHHATCFFASENHVSLILLQLHDASPPTCKISRIFSLVSITTMFSFSTLLPLSTGSGAEPALRLGGLKIDCFLLSTIVDIICPTPWIDLLTFFPVELRQTEREAGEDQQKDPLRLENTMGVNQKMSRKDSLLLSHGQGLDRTCQWVTDSFQPQPKFPCDQMGGLFSCSPNWIALGRNQFALGPCLPTEHGLTCHLITVDRLHHQLGVLDTVNDAQQRARQAQQLTEAVEAKVDEVVGKADDLGKDKATPDLAVLRDEREEQTWDVTEAATRSG